MENREVNDLAPRARRARASSPSGLVRVGRQPLLPATVRSRSYAAFLKRSLVVATLLLAAASCAHSQDDAALPTLNMDARPLEAAKEKPSSCTDEKKIERIKGGVPSGAVHVVEMTVKADRAVPFWMFEEAVRQRAAKYCCDGVSVLRALAEPGDALFTEVEATGWRRKAAAEGE